MKDDFEELSRELRSAVGGEFRRTAEEDEHAARKAQLRSRSLDQVAFELLSRGDTVVLAAGDRRFQGVIVHARGDLVTMETMQGELVHAHLDGPVLLKVIERSAEGGRGRDRYGAESFLARLREIELDEIPIELVAPGTGEIVAGDLAAVTKDHVMVNGDNGEAWFIPLDQIAVVKAR